MLSISIHPDAAEISINSYPEIKSQCVNIKTLGAYGGLITELTIWAPSPETAAELGTALRRIFPEMKAPEPEPEDDEVIF